jgi:hypothetical protein
MLMLFIMIKTILLVFALYFTFWNIVKLSAILVKNPKGRITNFDCFVQAIFTALFIAFQWFV